MTVTKHPEIWAALAAPFHPSDVKKRAGQGRQDLHYITARTVLNRLDEVMGPESWDFELKPWGDALIGTLVLRLPDGTVVKKSDVGGRAGMKTADDDTKSAASDCLKRCAVLVGVGRYLYNDGQVSFGAGPAQREPEKLQDNRSRAVRLLDWCAKEGHSGRLHAIAKSVYDRSPDRLSDEQAQAIYKLIKDSKAVAEVQQPPPRLPIEQRIEEDTRHSQAVNQMVSSIQGSPAPGMNANGNPVKFGWPHSGVSLFAWMKNLENAFKVGIIPQVREKLCGMHLAVEDRADPTFRGCSPAQVAIGATFAAQIVSKLPGYSGEFDKHLPVSPQGLRDKLWTAAGELAEALGQNPRAEVIEGLIQQTSQSMSTRFGGEVIDELEKCDNEEMLRAILEVIEADVNDSKQLTA